MSYSWFQTSQTRGQQYNDTSPYSTPWLDYLGIVRRGFYHCARYLWWTKIFEVQCPSSQHFKFFETYKCCQYRGEWENFKTRFHECLLGWEETNITSVNIRIKICINAFSIVPRGSGNRVSVGKIRMLVGLVSTHFVFCHRCRKKFNRMKVKPFETFPKLYFFSLPVQAAVGLEPQNFRKWVECSTSEPPPLFLKHSENENESRLK